MPNHIHNRITMIGDSEQIANCKKAIEHNKNGEWWAIDFRKIIPRPKRLDIEYPCSIEECAKRAMGDKALVFHAEPKEFTPTEYRVMLIMMSNIRRYGHPTWYDWSIANWGTKWGAYDCKKDTQIGAENQIFFDTAWSSPKKIVCRLSEMFPELMFKVDYVCEFADHGGTYIYRNGLMSNDSKVDGDALIDLCKEIKPDEVESYIKVNGKYEYQESEV